jgi:hypothetical protein
MGVIFLAGMALIGLWFTRSGLLTPRERHPAT